MKNKNSGYDRKRSETGPGPKKIEKFRNAEIDNILVKSKQGFITQTMLDNCINDYIDLLPVPEYLYSKVQTFNGLIRYIYNNLISGILPNSYRHDYKLLDDIFRNIYLPLCNAYSFTPNILLFCNLSGISEECISLYNNSVCSNENSNKDNTIKLIKTWSNEIESALVSNVSDHSSIGSMFLLKARYNYRENDTLTLQVESDVPKLDLKQIATIGQTGKLETPNK